MKISIAPLVYILVLVSGCFIREQNQADNQQGGLLTCQAGTGHFSDFMVKNLKFVRKKF
jgi:hypothetical protein